ncbi:MAG: YitT family protein [Anaeromyxobacter sp.]
MSQPTPAADRPDDLPPLAVRHTHLDDLQALVTATAFISLGVGLLHEARLVMGGTAGLALLLSRLTPLSFGQLFTALNLPFFWLAIRRKGWRFTVRTFLAVVLVSVASDHLGAVLRIAGVLPVYAALMGGFLVGVGLLVLFRHGASLGGINILALWLQERYGVRAGLFQMAIDAAIVTTSAFVVSPLTLVLSVLGVVALNLVLAFNHRPGRYIGT